MLIPKEEKKEAVQEDKKEASKKEPEKKSEYDMMVPINQIEPNRNQPRKQFDEDAIEELAEEGIQGLALMPLECERVREKINWLIEEKKIPVVTFNSDIVGTRRSCFVGMDNRKS